MASINDEDLGGVMSKQINKELKPATREFENCFSRAAFIRTINPEKRTVENVVLTEAPVVVMDWYRFEPIREIILIDGVQIPESRKVVLLDAHSRYSSSDVKGSTRDLKKGVLEDGTKAILGTIHVSETAEREWKLIQEEHLDSTSAGYMISREQSVYIEPKAEATVNGKVYRNDYEDGLTLVIRQYSEIFENSLLPIGADDRAKLRSKFSNNQEEPELTDEQRKQINQIINSNKHGGTMTDEEKRAYEEKLKAEYSTKVEEARKQGGEAEAQRVAGIYSIAGMMNDQIDRGKFDIMKEAKEFASNREKSVSEFSDLVYKNVRENGALKTHDPKIGLTDDEVKRFSILRAINAVATYRGDFDKAGASFEKAVIEAAREKQHNGGGDVIIPYDILMSGHFARAQQITGASQYAIDGNGKIVKRAMSVGTATAGGNLVGTNLLASSFIELLRNRSIMSMVGVTMLDGLVGNVDIPRHDAAGTAGWIDTEAGDVSDTQPTVGQISLRPRDLGARTTVGRRLMLQSTPSADRLVEQDLINICALLIDKAVPHGTGANGQPTGIENISGVEAINGAAFNWKSALNFKKTVKLNNAFKENMAYITNPTIESELEGTPKVSGFPVFLAADGKMAGHNLLSTNQISDGYMFFGDWSEVVLAMWGGLDIVIDAVTSNAGSVTIKVFQTVDVGLRHNKAINYSKTVAFS